MTKDELIDIINDLGRELTTLRTALQDAKAELDLAYKRLIEAQERNRKLDWALTKAEEGIK